LPEPKRCEQPRLLQRFEYSAAVSAKMMNQAGAAPVARASPITQAEPLGSPIRNPEQSELYLSGLRLAMGEPA
jgi:hypothetical protein